MEAKRDFSGKQLRQLILPLIMEQVLGITVGLADSIMVSSAGEAAVRRLSRGFHQYSAGESVLFPLYGRCGGSCTSSGGEPA